MELIIGYVLGCAITTILFVIGILFDNKSTKKLQEENYNLEGQISKWREDYFCLKRLKDIQIAELKKACDETQTLLDKQIEATYKLDKENAELKRKRK